MPPIGRHSTGYLRVFVQGRGDMLHHRVLAERAVGRALKPTEQVHHFACRRDDAAPRLVICEDNAYHRLLHAREAALRACGNASWRKCQYCRRYDDPVNMSVRPHRTKPMGQAYHKSCAARYRRALRNRD